MKGLRLQKNPVSVQYVGKTLDVHVSFSYIKILILERNFINARSVGIPLFVCRGMGEWTLANDFINVWNVGRLPELQASMKCMQELILQKNPTPVISVAKRSGILIPLKITRECILGRNSISVKCVTESSIV